MYTLILHHLESAWEKEYSKSGTSLMEEVQKALKFIKRVPSINEVIITKNNDTDFDIEYFDIYEYCLINNIKFRIIEYSYGWIKDNTYLDKELNITWCYATRFYYNENDVLVIPPWIRELSDKKILLGGCFEFACIDDMTTVLKVLKLNFKKIKKLIVR